MESHQISYLLSRLFFNSYGCSSNTYDGNIGPYFEFYCNNGLIPVMMAVELRYYRSSGARAVIPVNISYNSILCRSYERIVKTLIQNDYDNTIIRIVCKGGEVYYVGMGAVLDSNFNPLFLPFMYVEGVTLKDIIIKVSPTVFLNNTKLFEKALLHKIIPLYLSSPITSGIFCVTKPIIPKIVVEDLSGYFKIPPKPNNYNSMDEGLNNLLIDRIDSDLNSLS